MDNFHKSRYNGTGWQKDADRVEVCMKQQKDNDRVVFQSLAMVMQFGLNMLVPICIMSALGIWIDGKLGTSWVTIVLFVVGAIAGGQNIYHMARRISGGTDGEGPIGEGEPGVNKVQKGGSCENNRAAEKDE